MLQLERLGVFLPASLAPGATAISGPLLPGLGEQSVSPTGDISIKVWVRTGAEVTIDVSDSFDFLPLSKKRM